ncbi:MAG TPA: sigma-54 dependent transcriptional regulator [Polyangia bacterium]|jgi:DNA-binding NtrC family response regulator
MPTDPVAAAPADARDLTVLVAEDDDEMRELCRRVLDDAGYRVIGARDGTEALARLADSAVDLIVTDVRMPGPDGLDILRRAMAQSVRQPVILMTAFGTIEAAVEAMRQGAHYYITKPFDIDDLVAIVGSAAEQVRQLRAVQGSPRDDSFFPIVFRSAPMRDLLRVARDVAESQASVLITGSSGTGKEVLARAMHGMSPRRERPFVPLDCSAIPETLIESELFGHARGAFTDAVADKRGIIEQADGGTLFLDEIGNLALAVQAKLLRFLQERVLRRIGEGAERPVNVRVVSATNQDLRGLVRRGAFREDLYYRLAVIPLSIPDLRERREDIAPLVYHFIRKFNSEYRVDGIRPDALELLVGYAWPGNVRQLENAIERAVILRKAGLILARDLPEEIAQPRGPQRAAGISLEEMEQRYIQDLLQECRGNQSQVARILGINRRTLYRKLRKLEVD